MADLLIQGGRIIDPSQGIDRTGSVIAAAGKIAWLGEGVPPRSDYNLLNAEGLIVCPGFVDLHCHLRQPGFEEKETIATGSHAAAQGGFTTVCCMPNTNPPLDNPETIEFVKVTAAQEGAVRVLPIGCISRGRNGQELTGMAKLASAGAIAFSDDGAPCLDAYVMQQALKYSRASGMPVIDHCEDTALTKDGQINEGTVSAELGLHGIPAAAEYLMVFRDLVLAQLSGGHLHIAHVTTAGAVELIRQAKEKGIGVTAEATPHHLTLTEAAVSGYNADAKVNPPLRIEKDIEALITGLKDGVIDCIATDHAPHTRAEKQRDFTSAPFGISEFETALGSLMSLVHGDILPLNILIAGLTCQPAGIINRPELGTLKVGSPADVTIFSPGREWVVEPKKFVSKGKNTPLAGSVMKGRVMATIYGGNVVYQDKSIKIKTRVAGTGE